MSTLLLEKDNDTVSLNPSFFALFAKSCYLKKYGNEDVHYNNAKDALIDWAMIYDQNVEQWEVITDVEGIDTNGVSSEWAGFQAVAYKNEITKEIVIAYRGTDSLLDGIISDVQIAFNLTPQQTSPAIEFYNKIATSVSGEGYTISATGHSLGGALAQYVAAVVGISAVTFNAPGIPMPEGGDASGIVNYVNMNDFIGCLNTHIGETRYYLPDGIYLDGNFKPHSDYVGADFSKYIVLPSNVTWTLGYSLALWGYDINNNNTKLKDALSILVTKSNLDSAVLIIEEYFGSPSKLEDAFKFQIPNSYCYCIGSKGDDLLEGSSKNDKLWGNDGDDTLYGYDGNDTIYSVQGDDVLIGGKGNDDLRGSQGFDTYIFYTGDGNDVIKETNQTITSVKGIRYNLRQGQIQVDGAILTGGTWDKTTQTYVGYQSGITYSWSGVDNTQMIINYGNGDTIKIANFDNGDLGLFFDREIITDKDDIPDRLTRMKQVYADLQANNICNAYN